MDKFELSFLDSLPCERQILRVEIDPDKVAAELDADAPVVPLPANGSRTTHGNAVRWWLQDETQPIVLYSPLGVF